MSTIKVDTLQTRSGSTAAVTGAGFVATDQIRGNTTATSVTMPTTTKIGATAIVSASAGSATIIAEGGTNTTNIQQGLVKAYTCIDASEGVEFSSNDSFNIGSITDSATGKFTLVYTSNMATVRYNAPGGCYTATGHSVGTTAEATTGTQMRISTNDGSAVDIDAFMAIIGKMA